MWPLLTLAFGAFIAQTTEYLPIGLLPQIGFEFDVPKGMVGGLVTGYAWIAAITAIPLTLATARVNRKTLFLVLLGIITLANTFSAVAPSYISLAAFRISIALTHGVFWSILASFATRVAPRMSHARATAWVFSGISAAVVGGVPLATAIGGWVGWRLAFGLFAALGAAALGAGLVVIPPTSGSSTTNSHARLSRQNPRLYGAAIVTLLSLTSHFCSYTFVLPLLDSVVGVVKTELPLLLLIFGIAGIAGNAAGGSMSGRSQHAVALSVAGIVAAQAMMLFAWKKPILGWFEMAVWGASISMLIVGLQSWILEIAPEEADAASALYVTMFNMGIGSGALLGGVALDQAGSSAVLRLGTLCGIASLVVLGLTARISGVRQTEA